MFFSPRPEGTGARITGAQQELELQREDGGRDSNSGEKKPLPRRWGGDRGCPSLLPPFGLWGCLPRLNPTEAGGQRSLAGSPQQSHRGQHGAGQSRAWTRGGEIPGRNQPAPSSGSKCGSCSHQTTEDSTAPATMQATVSGDFHWPVVGHVLVWDPITASSLGNGVH